MMVATSTEFIWKEHAGIQRKNALINQNLKNSTQISLSCI